MRRLFTPTLILFLMAAGLSCRKETAMERSYDLGTSRALLSTGELLLDGQDAAPALPPETLQKLEQTPEGRQLVGVLQAQRLQRELINEANLLLATERYNDLAGLLERAQRENLATSQLLELAGLPQALQGLRLYCARRPYERAADLEQNLDFLRPWARQLQELSPAFQEFYQEQQQQLLAMRQQEAAAAEEKVLRELDRMLASTQSAPQGADFLAQAAADFPQLPILRFVQRTGDQWHPTDALRTQLAAKGFLARASSRERLGLELAVALTWNSLGTELRQRLADEWRDVPSAVSLTGTLLRAVCLRDIGLFEEGIVAWQAQAAPGQLLRDAPSYLPEAMAIMNQTTTGAPADSWRLPAPDFATVLIRLLEAAQ